MNQMPLNRKILYAVFVVLFAAGLLLRTRALSTPCLFQFDPHYDYSQDIYKNYLSILKMPGSGQSLSECLASYSFPKYLRTSTAILKWHPPAHHVLCAMLFALNPRQGLNIVKAYTFLCSILTLYFLFLLLRHFFGTDYDLLLLGMNFLLFLPAHILFSNFANNDVSFVPLCTLLILLSVRWDITNDSFPKVAFLGALCALSLLVKYTGIICVPFLCAVMLIAFLRKKISFIRFLQYTALIVAINAVSAGWFYMVNQQLHGNPALMPGVSTIREHDFLSFRFFDLLGSTENRWHESASVLTGFFASFFSLDYLRSSVQEIYLRNAVFCLALVPVSLIVIGIVSSVPKGKYVLPNVFLLLAIAGVVKLLWKYQLCFGELKSVYIMFLAPLGAVYYTEACRALKASNKNWVYALFALAIITDIAVMVYFYRYDLGIEWASGRGF